MTSHRAAALRIMLLAVAVFGYLTEAAAAQVRAGSIAALNGSATIRRGPRTIPAALAMEILVGDSLATSARSSLTVAMVDGSRLTLSESSSFTIDRAGVGGPKRDSTLSLLKGHLRAVVKFTTGGRSPNFEVRTPNAIAGVRGTDFETAYIVGKPCPGFPRCFRYTDVGVYEGAVEVRNPTSARPVAVRVAAGYETTVPCELPPSSPGPLGMGDITAPMYH
jgi:ferric-dicitrate binding protein FerR (iron transport regulator)